MPQSGLGSMQGSTEGCLPLKVVFHRGRLSRKLVFHQRSSYTEGRLPPKGFCFNSIEVDLILSVAQLSSAIHYLFNFPAAADVLALSSSSTSMISSASRIKVFKYRQTDRQMKPRIEVW